MHNPSPINNEEMHFSITVCVIMDCHVWPVSAVILYSHYSLVHSRILYIRFQASISLLIYPSQRITIQQRLRLYEGCVGSFFPRVHMGVLCKRRVKWLPHSPYDRLKHLSIFLASDERTFRRNSLLIPYKKHTLLLHYRTVWQE